MNAQINCKINCIVIRARRHDLHNWSGYSSHSRGIIGISTRVIRQSSCMCSHMHLLWRIPCLIDWLSAVTRQIAFVPLALWPTQWSSTCPRTLFAFIAVTLSPAIEWRLPCDRVAFFSHEHRWTHRWTWMKFHSFAKNRIVPSLERYFTRSPSLPE